MFKKQKEPVIEKNREYVCETCGCYVDPLQVTRVEVYAGLSSIQIYCKVHKPPYREIVVDDGKARYYSFSRIEMTKDGKPIIDKKAA